MPYTYTDCGSCYQLLGYQVRHISWKLDIAPSNAVFPFPFKPTGAWINFLRQPVNVRHGPILLYRFPNTKLMLHRLLDGFPIITL